MSDLSYMERNRLERLLGMESGHVLDFTHRTLSEFVEESVGLDIHDSRYDYDSGSKANRLRAFWRREPNHVVGKLVADILDYCRPSDDERELHDDCRRIAERLQAAPPVLDLSALTPTSGGRDFDVLAKSVRESIEKNEPEAGLDRLHTFVVKYIRVLCEKRSIGTDRSKPLHGLFGQYVKTLRQEGLIESQMAERILKSSISTLEAFNKVRNERSLAHDNPVLSHGESVLILNHVASTIRFIADLEVAEPAARESGGEAGSFFALDDELPF